MIVCGSTGLIRVARRVIRLNCRGTIVITNEKVAIITERFGQHKIASSIIVVDSDYNYQVAW